jgi:hypothetical protein
VLVAFRILQQEISNVSPEENGGFFLKVAFSFCSSSKMSSDFEVAQLGAESFAKTLSDAFSNQGSRKSRTPVPELKQPLFHFTIAKPTGRPISFIETLSWVAPPAVFVRPRLSVEELSVDLWPTRGNATEVTGLC